MEDEQILQLYEARNEQAIAATSEKYGPYCTSIARNILHSEEDAAECVNDTYLNAWNAIPPQRPKMLSTFLGKITRNLSLDRFRRDKAAKRGGGELTLALEEIGEVVSGSDPAKALDQRELVAAINGFLAGLSAQRRQIFVCRYWHFDSVAAIAQRQNMTENNVSAILSRLRKKLRSHLTERGFEL